MKQFYETWQADEKLSAVPRVLSWSQNPLIVERCKSSDERQINIVPSECTLQSKTLTTGERITHKQPPYL